MITVHVLFFSVLRDLSGQAELTRELPAGSTLADLLEQLFAEWPRLREWSPSLLLAIDHTYVKRETAPHDGAEVALMPPVQGG